MLCYYVNGHAIRTTQVLNALPPAVPFIGAGAVLVLAVGRSTRVGSSLMLLGGFPISRASRHEAVQPKIGTDPNETLLSNRAIASDFQVSS